MSDLSRAGGFGSPSDRRVQRAVEDLQRAVKALEAQVAQLKAQLAAVQQGGG